MNKQDVQNDGEKWLSKLAVVHDGMKSRERLPVFSEAAAQVYVCPFSPHFPPINLGRHHVRNLWSALLWVSVSVPSQSLIGCRVLCDQVWNSRKKQSMHERAGCIFSVLSYAFDPAQLLEVWHLINLAFFSFSPLHLPYSFTLSLSFLCFLRIQAFPVGIWSQKQNQWKSPSLSPPISLIRIKRWCYYLRTRCSTTFNSLPFLRPSIFCPTLSFPGEIWGGWGSSESFLLWLSLFVSHSLSLPPFFILLLSLSHTMLPSWWKCGSVTAGEMKAWFYRFLCSVKPAVMFSNHE